ncbi:hypothetical protein D3C74_458650 [compost metagenome]
MSSLKMIALEWDQNSLLPVTEIIFLTTSNIVSPVSEAILKPNLVLLGSPDVSTSSADSLRSPACSPLSTATPATMDISSTSL